MTQGYQPNDSPWGPPSQPVQPSQSDAPWSAPTQPTQPYTPPPMYAPPRADSYFAPHPGVAPSAYSPPTWPAQQGGQWESLGTGGARPTARRGRGRMIAAVVAVVALAGGGAATYVALGQSNSTGAKSAEAAVRTIVSDINKSDLIGVLDDLAPGERKALANPFLDTVNQLKRTKIIKGNANPSKVSGLNLQVKQLTFSGTSISLTPSVQVVEITGGTLDVSSDVRAVPFTEAFVQAAFPHGLPQSNGSVTHVDIAQQVHDNGEPLRVAAQKVGGKWYPSLGYTIAYQASGQRAPTASDAIAAHGSTSPDAAVRDVVSAAVGANIARLIELASPDELGAVHTYGGLILSKVGRYSPPDVAIDQLTFTDKSIADGTRVFLKSLSWHTRSGDRGSLTVDGACYDVVANGNSKRQCPAETVSSIVNAIEQLSSVTRVTPAQRTALAHLVSGLSAFGIDTSESGGQWYVDPVRSYMDIVNEALSGLQGDDAIVLLTMFTQGH